MGYSKAEKIKNTNIIQEAELCIAYIRDDYTEDLKQIKISKEQNKKLYVVAVLENYNIISQLYELGHEYSLLSKDMDDELIRGVEVACRKMKKFKDRFVFFSKGTKHQLFLKILFK